MTFSIGRAHRHNAGFLENNQNDPRTRHRGDVQTCNHCQKLIDLHASIKDFAVCMGCMKLTCGSCATRALTYGCEPFIKKLELYMESQYKLDKLIKTAGLEAPVPPQPIFTG